MKPTLQQFIKTAVEYEFKTRYTCDICKAFLYKNLLINPDTNNPYNNRQIGYMIGVDAKKVGDYLFQMKVFKQGKANVLLLSDFKARFDTIEEACVKYSQRLTIEKGIEILEAPTAKLKAKRLDITNINYN